MWFVEDMDETTGVGKYMEEYEPVGDDERWLVLFSCITIDQVLLNLGESL